MGRAGEYIDTNFIDTHVGVFNQQYSPVAVFMAQPFLRCNFRETSFKDRLMIKQKVKHLSCHFNKWNRREKIQPCTEQELNN